MGRPVSLPMNFSFNGLTTIEPGNYTKFGPVCPQTSYGSGLGILNGGSAAGGLRLAEEILGIIVSPTYSLILFGFGFSFLASRPRANEQCWILGPAHGNRVGTC